MKVCISKGNSKMGRVANISLLPGASCVHDAPCRARGCYARKLIGIYPSVKRAWGNNLKVARDTPDKYFAEIKKYIAKHKVTMFRWHVAGDILNQDYFNNMVGIAREFPDVKFLVFTKMHHLKYGERPDNLTVIFSMWPGWGNEDKKISRAWVRDKNNVDNRIPKTAIECQGNCETCGACWGIGKQGLDVVFDKH